MGAANKDIIVEVNQALARNDTETFVHQWISAAKSTCDAARTSLTNYVSKQNTAVQESDRV